MNKLNNKDDKINNWSKTSKDIAPYLGLGTQLAATIILMFFLGRWLDSKFNSEPFLTILFAFLGGTAGTYNFIKVVLNLNKKEKSKRADSEN